MIQTTSYQQRRGELETYFDRTAVEAWKRLTSDVPVGRIRATVRAGRDRMRATLLGWLPQDLHGTRILDAGCGTGAFAREAVARGAHVVAIDLSPKLVALAAERNADVASSGTLEFRVGDMLDATLGRFDYVVAMDSLIHYQAPDVVRALSGVRARTSAGILFTFAPKTVALTAMHTVGRLFPRADRAPAIEPVAEAALRRALAAEPKFALWDVARSERIVSGFYTSQAMELQPQ